MIGEISRIRHPLCCVLIGVLLTILSPPSEGNCGGGPYFTLELPDDQDRKVETYPAELLWNALAQAIGEPPNFPARFDPFCLKISGQGPIEVGVALSNVARGDLIEGYGGSVDYVHPVFFSGLWVALEVEGHSSGHRFRDILLDPEDTERQVSLTFHPEALYALQDSANPGDSRVFFQEILYGDELIGEDLEIVVVLNRIQEYCAMSAMVSGDINNHFSGDVAYFNALEPGRAVKKGMMVGTIGETQAHETLDGFGTFELAQSPENALDLAVSLGLINEEERQQAAEDLEQATGQEQEPEQESSGFAEWARQELQPDEGEQGDNFGLNLTSLRLDADPTANRDRYDDEEAGSNAASAATTAMMSGAFTLTLSGSANIEQGPLQEGQARAITVTPSTITATVGLGDKGGDRIPFEMSAGQPMRGEVITYDSNSDYIVGWLQGELESKGVYTLEGEGAWSSQGVAYNSAGEAIKPRKLKISVVTSFSAKRGSLSCGQ